MSQTTTIRRQRRGIGIESRPPRITTFMPAGLPGEKADNALYKCERCRRIMGAPEMRAHSLDVCTERMRAILIRDARRAEVDGGSPYVDGGALIWLVKQAKAAGIL